MKIEELTSLLKIERATLELKANMWYMPATTAIPKLSPSRWATILTDYPELKSLCSYFDEFAPTDWSGLLKRQPQFAARCSCWADFTIEDWRVLLRHQPQLYAYCAKKDDPAVLCGLLGIGTVAADQVDTSKFSDIDWFWAMKYNPDVKDACPCKESFSHAMWWSILVTSPTLATDCPYLQDFDSHERKLLTRLQPGLEFVLRQQN